MSHTAWEAFVCLFSTRKEMSFTTTSITLNTGLAGSDWLCTIGIMFLGSTQRCVQSIRLWAEHVFGFLTVRYTYTLQKHNLKSMFKSVFGSFIILPILSRTKRSHKMF